MLMTEAHVLEDVLVSKRRGKWVIKSDLWPIQTGKNKKLKEKLEYFYHTVFRPVFFRMLSVFSTLLSLIVIFSESTLFIQTKITPLSLAFSFNNGVFLNEILSLIPLTYIVLATHIPLFEIRLEGIYGLYSNKSTQPSSLIYSACFLARLMPILVYNFLMLIQVSDTDFMEMMDLMNFMPRVCEQYFTFFPIVLGILCVLNLFNLYNKFVRAVGLGRYAFAEEILEERKVDGKMLVVRDRAERERQIRHSRVSQSKSNSWMLEHEQKYSITSSLNG